MEKEILKNFLEIEKEIFELETDDKIFKLFEENKDVCEKVFFEIKEKFENGEYKIFYQPYIKDEIAIGAEALFRLKIDGVAISPMSVFRLASFFAYEEELTLKELEHVCKDVVRFTQKMSQNFTVSVNVNPNLYNAEFCRRFLEITDSFGVTKNIAIEILEVASANGIPQKDFETMRSRGIKMYLDDFGSGYAGEKSLELPFDVVKFYGGLITGIDKNLQNKRTVKRIATYCKEKGITTIAEHVERRGEVQACLEAGVDLFQGYYFEKPISSDMLIKKYQDIVGVRV